MSASRACNSARLATGTVRITQRDRQIIVDVARFGAVSRSQLMTWGYFQSVSRANRRLQLLTEAKYLRRAYVATGPQQHSTIYLLGPTGTSIAIEDCCLNPVEVRRQARRTLERLYLEHHLGVVSVCLVARQPCPALQLRRLLAEPECRHEYEVVERGRAVRRLIKPDAMMLFARGSAPLPVFIEFDRGNTSLPQMSGVFSRYGSYWTETAFQTAYCMNTPFVAAVVTTAGQRRIDHLIGLTRARVPLVKFTTLDLLESEGFAGRIWQSARSAGSHTLWDGTIPGGGL